MAVVFDAIGSADAHSSGGGPFTFTNMTVGSGANRALVVTLAFDKTPGTVTCHWDSTGTNQLMTQISLTSGAGGFVGLYGLVAPTSGNKTLSVSVTASVTDIFIDAISFTGVNQTGGSTTFYNANSATSSSSPLNLTITSASTDAAVAICVTMDGISGPTQTLIFNDGGTNVSAAATYNINSASAAFSFPQTNGGADGNNVVGCAIAQAATAVATPFGYFDFGNHPALPKSPEDKWLPQNSVHRLQDMLVPTILAAPPASFRFDFDRHPPAPPKGPEFIFPNVILPYPYEVEVDALGTADVHVTSATSASFTNLTVGTGANRALVATLSFSTNPGAVTATWDSGGTNQVMTEYSLYAGFGQYVALFGLVAPTSGNKTLSISWANSASAFVNAMSFINVNQNSPFYGVVTGENSVGNEVIDVVKASIQDATISVGVTNSPNWIDTPGQQTLFTDGVSGFGGAAGYEYAGVNFTGNSVEYIYSASPGVSVLIAVTGMAITAFPAPQGAILNPQTLPFDFYRHPPTPPKGPEFIFPNVPLSNPPAIPLVDLLRRAPDVFYRHPPPYVHGPDAIFPNLTLYVAPPTPLPDLLRRAQFTFDRHPPAYYRSSEFRPVNFILQEIPGAPVVVTAFIRNTPPLLAQIRAAAPSLAQVREESAELAQIRAVKPVLTK